MPGYSPKEKIINKNDSPAPLVPSPVFGLAKNNGNFDFTKSIEVVLQSVMEKFWSKFADLCHYGHKSEEDYNKNLGFPFFIYLISLKKTEQACMLLRKYPKFAKNQSPQKWTPLHEAIYQKNCILIHILMRLGGDPDLVGSRDSIEDDDVLFGNQFVSPKTMTETEQHGDMKLYLDFEIDHRKKGTTTDSYHICTNFCQEDLKVYETQWKRRNSADDTEDILSDDDMIETVVDQEEKNKTDYGNV